MTWVNVLGAAEVIAQHQATGDAIALVIPARDARAFAATAPRGGFPCVTDHSAMRISGTDDPADIISIRGVPVFYRDAERAFLVGLDCAGLPVFYML